MGYVIEDKYMIEWGATIGELEAAVDRIDELKDQVNDNIGVLNEHIQRYNNLLNNADAIRNKVHEAMNAHLEGESNAYRTSKEGEDFAAWMDGWEALDLDGLNRIEEVEVERMGHSGEMDELPRSFE